MLDTYSIFNPYCHACFSPIATSLQRDWASPEFYCTGKNKKLTLLNFFTAHSFHWIHPIEHRQLFSGNLCKSKIISWQRRSCCPVFKRAIDISPFAPSKYLIALVSWYTEPLKNHYINPTGHTVITPNKTNLRSEFRFVSHVFVHCCEVFIWLWKGLI